jgi:hypothetical protein
MATATGVFRKYRGMPLSLRRRKTYVAVIIMTGTASGTNAVTSGIIGDTEPCVGGASGSAASAGVITAGYLIVATAAGANGGTSGILYDILSVTTTAAASGAGSALGSVYEITNLNTTGTASGNPLVLAQASTAQYASGAASGAVVSSAWVLTNATITGSITGNGIVVSVANYIYLSPPQNTLPIITWMA